MDNSGVAAYLRLRDMDPILCRDIVRFAERLAERHNLEPVVSVEMKQALCQFAIDTVSRRATRQIRMAR